MASASDSSTYCDARLDDFMALSEVMLDWPEPLSERAGRAFFELLYQATPVDYVKPDAGHDDQGTPPPVERTFDALFEVFHRVRAYTEETGTEDTLESQLAAVLYGDIVLGGVLKNLLTVWYNGALGTRTVAAEHYQDALVWRAIGGHPLGVPGPYYGSWAWPPPVVVTRPGEGDA